MRRAFSIVLLLALLPRPAAAQKRFEISGGYAPLHDLRDEVTLPAGWMAGAALDLTPAFSVVADFSGQYKTISLFTGDARLSVLSAMGGMRASARVGPLTEFGQVLAGVVRTSGSAFGSTTTGSSFSVQPGVGIDYPQTGRWGARAELDVRLLTAQTDGQNNGWQYRFVAALVYRRHRSS
jgi:hypothetical protein